MRLHILMYTQISVMLALTLALVLIYTQMNPKRQLLIQKGSNHGIQKNRVGASGQMVYESGHQRFAPHDSHSLVEHHGRRYNTNERKHSQPANSSSKLPF